MIATRWILWALAGCDEGGASVDSAAEDDTQATLTLHPNESIDVYSTASWTSNSSTRTRLEVTTGSSPVLVTDWIDGPDASDVPLLGLWTSDTFTVSLTNEAGAVLATSTVTTGAGPTELSRMTVTGAASWSGYVVTQIGTTETQTVVILAPNGRPVWYWQVAGIYLNRVLLRRDGLGVWLLASPDPGLGIPGWIGSVAWDGSLLVDVEPLGHDGEGCSHDLFELADGRVAFLGPDTRNIDEIEYAGDSLFALDAEGNEAELWSFWDDFAPTPDVIAPFSWTHANALRWNNERQSLWVGSREMSALVELDPATWRPVTVFGGATPSFVSPEETALPLGQHQFDFLDDRLVVHDNRDATRGSRVVVYDLDFAAEPPAAVETWEGAHEPPIFDFIMGDVSWVGPERLLVTWSATGLIEERHLDGTVPWSVGLDLGALFPYTQYVEALPGSTPATTE
ncbi:hypothetical protein LBMAG42_21070 [Deltaproteobacteria bacterium]|nr:hypothetical protein LBMAG42_21070 [Deltaproteobacteria bacterium]